MSRAPLGVGIVGAGNISSAYLRLTPLFRGIEIRAISDLNPAAAKAQAEKFGIRALGVDDMMSAPDIDIVVNLTIPAAHAQVSGHALDSGKHVYSEKPFVLSVAEGRDLGTRAAARNLRIGSAPDTFLGGAHQQARALIDEGALGRITSGTAFVMSHGMEAWHPNPDFFFQPGAGPILDMGPYYITNLVQLIGPVRRIVALTATPSPSRTIGNGPRSGETVPVDTPTTIQSLLEFDSGAIITLVASWDVWAHRHAPMELYGTEGALFVPDPNFFGGEVSQARTDGTIRPLPAPPHPFSRINDDGHANYRAAGLADMAAAIAEGRPHRASFDLALHVVDVMTAILRAGETGGFVEITTTCARPDALDAAAASALLA